ncbi:MAG: C-GCAxxG-C-C family protein [Candidatus Izemoplasmatales bacterium]|nr:C-GCAxxG-C-C family protein [Candidatus Izemoplasmatales bacterium]
MSKEKTIKYYLEENFNCAETILLLSIEEYDLQVKKDQARILKGFGGGMYMERTCGVVTGGIAVLSLLYDGEHLKNKVIKYQDLVKERFQSLDCEKIKTTHRENDVRCAGVINDAYTILKSIINKKEEA